MRRSRARIARHNGDPRPTLYNHQRALDDTRTDDDAGRDKRAAVEARNGAGQREYRNGADTFVLLERVNEARTCRRTARLARCPPLRRHAAASSLRRERTALPRMTLGCAAAGAPFHHD